MRAVGYVGEVMDWTPGTIPTQLAPPMLSGFILPCSGVTHAAVLTRVCRSVEPPLLLSPPTPCSPALSPSPLGLCTVYGIGLYDGIVAVNACECLLWYY